MSESPPLRLFEAFGIELEYMIVRGDTLDVLPVADALLRAAASSSLGKTEMGRAAGAEPESCSDYPSEVEMGPLCWSNELVLHVIELKANGPARSLEPLPAAFQQAVARINALLEPMGGILMPSAAHPWMNPDRDTRLWPHDYGEVYRAFDRVFGCRGHGWSNLQSMHINLPFADDAEFGRLHAAVRLVLPIIPALAAGSPIIEGGLTGLLDNRLAFYRTNCAKIPSITGCMVPEAVFTRRDYEEQILHRIYRDIAPYDPDEILRDEWVNARGAIARFCRNTIEIRVVDVQECPAADLAVAQAIVAAIRSLVDERWIDLRRQQRWAAEPLDVILQATTKDGESAVICDRAYLDVFGYPSASRCTAGDLWRHLAETLLPSALSPRLTAGPRREGKEPARGGRSTGFVRDFSATPLRTILDKGTLARRIVRTLDADTSLDHIASVFRELCGCLAEGRMFV